MRYDKLKKTIAALSSAAMMLTSVSLPISPQVIYAESDSMLANSEENKTRQQIIDEMIWGVNLPDFFIGDDGYYGAAGSTEGYVGDCYAYPIGVSFWAWNGQFSWLSYNQIKKSEPFEIEATLPTYESGDIANWVGGLFRVGVVSDSRDRDFSVKLSNCRLIKTDNTEMSLDTLNTTYDANSFFDPDLNGNSFCYLNMDMSEVPEPSADLSGCMFKATVEFENVPLMSDDKSAKVNYFFERARTKMDQYELTDLFIDQGVDVIRLPVSWSQFINDTTYEIDQEWLEAVRDEIDHILSKNVYCILDMHNDYMETSFVGDHWADDWTGTEYKEYVDARFASAWEQIANYFKDYPDKLIFEPLNELVGWNDHDVNRMNELNSLFTQTVRSTGGNNAKRLLCLGVAHYNDVDYLSKLVLPEDDNIAVTLHTYRVMEDYLTSYTSDSYLSSTDEFFEKINQFTYNTGVPVILGEVGLLSGKNDPAQAPKVKYLFDKAVANHVPTLWWEDCLLSTPQTCLYDVSNNDWGRPLTLSAIREATGWLLTLPENMEIVTDAAAEYKIGKRYIEDAVISFKAKDGYTAANTMSNATELTADQNGIYTVTFGNTDIIISSDIVPVKSILNSANITLGGELGLNFYVTVPDEIVSAGAKAVMNGPNGEKAVTLSTLTKDDKGRYMVTYKLKAVDIDKKVSFKLTDNSGNTLDLIKASGAEIDGNTIEYGVYDYVASAKASGTITDSDMNIINTMYAYGAYSAKWKYGTELPSDVNTELPTLNKADFEKYALKQEGANEKITLTGASLVLDSNTAFRLYFTVSDDIADHSIKLSGNELTPHETETVGKYYVDIENIGAGNLKTYYTVSFDGSYKVTVSAMTYVYNYLKSGMNDENLFNLLRAICAYSDAVDAA